MKKILNSISKGFQQVGPAIMPVIAVLPIAGFLLGIGSAVQQQALIDLLPFLGVSGVQHFGMLINAVGNLIIGNLGLFFAVGVAMNLSGKKSMAAFSGLLAYLVMNKTIEIVLGLSVDSLASTAYANVLGIYTLQTGVFGGLMVGVMVYQLYKRFHDIQLPQALSFFQGERFVPIISTLGAIILGLVMIVIWTPIQGVFDAFTNWLIATPYRFLAVFLYGFIMRLVQAFGLQHLIYPFFYFQMGSYTTAAGNVVTGESSIFFAQMADGVPVTVGGFMTGSYINSIMCVAVALAIYHAAKKERKEYVKGVMSGGAITAIFTGVSEPIEFSYLLISPFLWFVNSVMVGLGYAVTDALQIRLGTGLAGNLIDFILYGIIPRSHNWYLLIPVGAVFFVVQYLLFSFFIRKMDIKTPGREDEDVIQDAPKAGTASEFAAAMVEYFGGKSNIVTLENCFTRVRVECKDRSLINKAGFMALGATGVTEPGQNNVQVIFGPQSERIVNDMKAVIAGQKVKGEAIEIADANTEELVYGKEEFAAVANGQLIPLESVKDDVFSKKMMGEGFAIEPKDGNVVSPVNGKVVTVFPTKHAIGIKSDLGKEVIVHMGLDTVELQGEGFKVYVKDGDDVQAGDKLARFDKEFIEKKGLSTVIPVVMPNVQNKKVTVKSSGTVKAGELLDVTIE